MKRRVFGKYLTVAGLISTIKRGWALPASRKVSKILPDITKNGNSVEICINSRYSFHGGYSPEINDKVIANVVWATVKAPLIAEERVIYAALEDNLYTCEVVDDKPVLKIHIEGDNRVDSLSAFQVGVATIPEGAAEDAGVALHWAQLASVAFWNSTTNKPASLPSEAAWNSARTKWNTSSELHLVSCFGTAKSVNGLNDECVAISSDNTLTVPSTDGMVSIEDALKAPCFGTEFEDGEVTKQELSQLLWASYGATPHTVIGGHNAANAVASHTAKYFLLGRIYLVTSEGVQRFQIRNLENDKTSRDHRLENVSSNDYLSQLRQALPRLPKNAPVYILFCGSTTEAKQLMEAGFAGAGALLQATALGLQGHYIAQFSDDERTAIQGACKIEGDDLPLLVFSAGYAAGTKAIRQKKGVRADHLRFSARVESVGSKVVFSVTAVKAWSGTIEIYNYAGRRVGVVPVQHGMCGEQRIKWKRMRVVASGAYTCVLSTKAGKQTVSLNIL